jgi:tryptophanyl-tRNA synthetase
MDDSALTAKKIKGAVTDLDNEIRFDPENKPGVSNLLGIYSAVSGKSIESVVSELSGKGYGDLKSTVSDAVLAVIEPIRERANELLSDETELDRLLAIGAERANARAQQTLADVYDKIGFIPSK